MGLAAPPGQSGGAEGPEQLTFSFQPLLGLLFRTWGSSALQPGSSLLVVDSIVSPLQNNSYVDDSTLVPQNVTLPGDGSFRV